MKKEFIIFLISVIVVAITIIIVVNINSKNDIQNIKYDIKITKYDFTPGGYASTTKYELIRIKSGKAYIIENYYVYGREDSSKKGDHYKILEERQISEDKVNNLVNFINNYEDTSISEDLYEWEIEYKGKKIQLKSYKFI